MATQTAQLLPEVEEFLARQPLAAVIGGEHAPSANGETFTTIDPGTGQVMAEVYAAQPRKSIERCRPRRKRSLTHRGPDCLSKNAVRCCIAWPIAVEQRKPIICADRVARLRQAVSAGRGRRAELRRHDAVLHQDGVACRTAERAGRRPARSVDRASAVGTVRIHLSRGTSRSCWPAGASRPPWRPATRS